MSMTDVVLCDECMYDGMVECPLCYIERQTLTFINHGAEFYCAKGERKKDESE